MIEQRLDVKDAYLSKDLTAVERWNKLAVVDEDPEFLDEFNDVISDGSIPNGEDKMRHMTKNKKIAMSIWNLVYREKMMTG